MIYMITNKLNGKSYIGQTTQKLSTRFQQHWYQRNNEKYKNEMYSDMRGSSIEDWAYCELEEFEDERAAIAHYNTEGPNGYNKVGGSKQVVVGTERYKGQKIKCSNGMIFDNAMAAAVWLYDNGKGKNIDSCKTNLFTHLKGRTQSCYHFFFEIIEESEA